MPNPEPSDAPAIPANGIAPGDTESSRTSQRWREIPSVSSLVAHARQCGSTLTDEALTRAIRAELETVRAAIQAGDVVSRDVIAHRVSDAVLAL
jgi:hypothetical protein